MPVINFCTNKISFKNSVIINSCEIKYPTINPVVDRRKPFYDNKTNLFNIPVNAKYRYYTESIIMNENHMLEYYILLSKIKFSKNARKCNTDMYKRCKINIRGDMKIYVITECENRGNIDVNFIERGYNYDVFRIE